MRRTTGSLTGLTHARSTPPARPFIDFRASTGSPPFHPRVTCARRLITYNGSRPFTAGSPLSELDASWDPSAAFPWVPGHFSATEHWAAMVDKHGWGVGIINPQREDFIGGATRTSCTSHVHAAAGAIMRIKMRHAQSQNMHTLTNGSACACAQAFRAKRALAARRIHRRAILRQQVRW